MQPIQLSIPTPCHEDWDKMTPNQQGRFCGSCAKTVVDFSMMTDAQLIGYFETLKSANVCGRVYPDQLNRQLQQPVVIKPRKKMYRLWQYAAAVLFFFTKGNTAKAQGEIRPKLPGDTVIKVHNVPDLPIRLGGIRRVDIPENVHPLPALITQFFITDENNNPIAGASVELLPLKKWMTTDSSGKINLGKAHTVKEVKIAAVGYENKEIALRDVKGNSVQLVKNFLMLGEVAVQCDHETKLRLASTVAGGISVQKSDEIKVLPEIITPRTSNTIFSIFPNPVQKGKEFSLTITNREIKGYRILIADANGKTVLQQNITGVIKGIQKKINIPALWSSGLYIVSVVNENGETLQSEKIMLL